MNTQDNFNEDISDKNCENSNSPDIEIKEEWDDDSDDFADNSYEEKPESIEISEDSREATEQLIEVLETEENSDSGKQLNIEIQLFGESLIIDGVFITMLMIMSKLSSHSTFWTTKLYCPQAPISFSSTHGNILKPKLLIS